jgi:hypothetical protein
MAKTYEVLTPRKGRFSRPKGVSTLTVSGKRKFQGIWKAKSRFGNVRSSLPSSSSKGYPGVLIGRPYDVELKIGGTVVTATVVMEGKKVVYGRAKIQKNVCQYGQLQQRESKIWPKALVEFSEAALAQPRGELRQSHATPQRDYDTVVSEYQHLLDQKYAGGLNQQQQQELRALKEEINEFGKERFRKISSSQEYREFQHALQVLEEFNKNVSALKNPRRR